MQSNDPFQPLFGAFGGKQRLLLDGFLPDEPLRLLAYRVQGTKVQFFAWQDYTTDPRGQMQVLVDLPGRLPTSPVGQPAHPDEWLFFAYARETHFVAQKRFNTDGENLTNRFAMDLYCPGAAPSRITSLDTVRTVSTSLKEPLIQELPGFGSRVTAPAPAGTQLTVFGQPKCIDNAFWWQVWLPSPVTYGWAAESIQGQYLLEPVK